ncbi:hypothetical protein LAZ67_20001634 [Cordylochernes scorpioides]|uniref:Uncharacterized protein n=1 Tax=Cordylochernes scorpioides TaxID=51811 RepID=A0ABY6LPE1_9ARAC|nr:hypothetical protein LAZ67_20001634 [Cordylochernes scorpioides]
MYYHNTSGRESFIKTDWAELVLQDEHIIQLIMSKYDIQHKARNAKDLTSSTKPVAPLLPNNLKIRFSGKAYQNQSSANTHERRILEVHFIVHLLSLDSVGDFVEAPKVASTDIRLQG